MRFINYMLSVLLIITWCIGFFNHFAGQSIHFLFMGALSLLLINIINYEYYSNKHIL